MTKKQTVIELQTVAVPLRKEVQAAEKGTSLIAPLVTQLRSISITCEENYERVIDIGRRIATTRANVEDRRKRIKKPILTAGKEVDAFFKPLLAACDEGRVLADVKIFEWHRFVEAKAEREREKLEKEKLRRQNIIEAMNKKKLEAAASRAERLEVIEEIRGKQEMVEERLDVKIEQVTDDPGRSEGVAFREVIDVEITVPSEVPQFFGSLPDETLCLWKRQFDMVNLKELGKRGVQIPGVVFRKRKATSVKGL